MRADTFDLDVLPEEMPTREADVLQVIRSYLIRLTAIVWRVLGISWDRLAIVMLLFYVLTGLTVYLVFRLGMGPVLSLLFTGALITAPPLMQNLAGLRDYSKVPFLLGVLFVLGLTLRRPISFGTYLACAGAAAVTTGIGMGFRQDVIVAIPATLVVLAVFARGTPRLTIGRRAAGLAVYGAVLVLTAFPVPWLYEEGGSEFPHNVIMGMTTPNNHRLDFGVASHTLVQHERDEYVYMVPREYAYRTAGYSALAPQNLASDQPDKRYLAAVGRMFPADALLRGIAAVRQFLCAGIFSIPGEAIFKEYGVLIACCVVLITAGNNLAAGAGLLFLLLYFGAYPSLQFTQRHFFHHAFIPYWFAGTFVACTARFIWTCRHPAVRRAWFETARPSAWWSSPALRRITPLAATVLIAGAGTYGAAAWRQHDAVAGLMARRAEAVLEPLPVSRRNLGSSEAVDLKTPLQPAAERLEYAQWQAHYLVAEFRDVDGPFPLWLRYSATAPDTNDFSGPVTVIVKPKSGQTVDVRYFFPVYETYNWSGISLIQSSYFEGLVMTREAAGRFQGLFRVKNASAMGLWPYFAAPSDPDAAVYRQTLTAPHAHEGLLESIIRGPANPYVAVKEAITSYGAPAPGNTEEQFERVLAQRPESGELWYHFARFLQGSGQPERALEALERCVAVSPRFEAAYQAIAAHIEETRGIEAVPAKMRALTLRHPEAYGPYFFLGRALEAAGKIEGALRAYNEALERFPEHALSLQAVQRIRSRMAQRDPAVPDKPPP